MNKLIYLPIRFLFLFIIIVASFFLENPIEFLGMSVWAYSCYLFWFEEKFYKVADQKKYRFSFIRLLTKIKTFVKKQNKRFQIIFLISFPVMPFLLFNFIMKSYISFIPFFIGQMAYFLDHQLRKRISW